MRTYLWFLQPSRKGDLALVSFHTVSSAESARRSNLLPSEKSASARQHDLREVGRAEGSRAEEQRNLLVEDRGRIIHEAGHAVFLGSKERMANSLPRHLILEKAEWEVNHDGFNLRFKILLADWKNSRRLSE
jgi:hypothetical protein